MYSALYRRLRPKLFGDIIGQEHIVKTLKNQISSGRVTHAYLFCGTRGTGKTSTALVFAKAINCETPNGGEPCGTCPACAAIARGTGFNVIEIDAASNNGVDNIRDIREEVKYPPAEGRYKVYIIDEVHMLSVSAFNALLKTLEEPPAGVIFILATTDPQKIPLTVLSRCQRFDFKRIPSEEMAKALEGYLADEGIICDADAVRYAARAADGAMRDAISILDQCAAFYMNERITLDGMMEIMGSVGTEALSGLLKASAGNDTAECLDIIDTFIKNGRDVHQLAQEYLAYLRDTLIAVTAGNNAARILDLSEERTARLRESASGLSSAVLMRYISSLSELIPKMRYAGSPRILLESEIIGLTAGIITAAPVLREAAAKPQEPESHESESKQAVPSRVNKDVARIAEEWSGFIAGFGPLERSLFISTTAEYAGENLINVVCQNPGAFDILKSKRESVRQVKGKI